MLFVIVVVQRRRPVCVVMKGFDVMSWTTSYDSLSPNGPAITITISYYHFQRRQFFSLSLANFDNFRDDFDFDNNFDLI